MTLEKREQLDNFKSVLSMMYDTIGIDELVAEKSDKVLIRVRYRSGRNRGKEILAFFWYDISTGNSAEAYIKDMRILPISKNIAVVEEANDGENCFIKVLDKNTLDIIEETSMSISDNHKKVINSIVKYNPTHGYNIREDDGYVGVTVPVDGSGEKNIHGQPINLDYTFKMLKKNIFISNAQSVIRVYDNVEDMHIVNEIRLDTFGDEIVYYPIFNSKQLKAKLPQVIFMHIPSTDRLYAYSFDDNKIHVVRDTRYKIGVSEFISELEECLNTSDTDRKEKFPKEYAKFKGNLEQQREYERTQFDLDYRSLTTLEDNKFEFDRVQYQNGCYLTLRTLFQCVKEYQRDYNGESNIKYRFEHNSRIERANKRKERMRDIDIATSMSLTPYKIKSMQLIDRIRELQDKEKLGKLVITDEVVSFDELLKREGIH